MSFSRHRQRQLYSSFDSKSYMKILLASLFFLIAALQVKAQEGADTRKRHFNLDKGVAIQGYDPVAYFKENKSVKGKKDFSVYFQGVTYYFSSGDNKEVFKKNPSVYEPQYGGWCAYAMGANGGKVNIDPETFKIKDNKLYLFYNRFLNNTLKSWDKDETNLKSKADKNWTKTFH
jgi:YHS domain-containing protein